MFSVRLPKELETELNDVSQQLKINKSKLVIKALKEHLEEIQDCLTIEYVLKQNNKKYTHAEVLHELGL